jgi:hypothetical protein
VYIYSGVARSLSFASHLSHLVGTLSIDSPFSYSTSTICLSLIYLPTLSQIEASQLLLVTPFCYAMDISRVEPDSDLSLALRAPGAMSSMPSTSQPESEPAPVSLLGYPLCFKRPRSSSSSSCSSPSKRLEREPEPDTESRRAVVRAWGNLPLSVADPDVFVIMENEKHRQVTEVPVLLISI